MNPAGVQLGFPQGLLTYDRAEVEKQTLDIPAHPGSL